MVVTDIYKDGSSEKRIVKSGLCYLPVDICKSDVESALRDVLNPRRHQADTLGFIVNDRRFTKKTGITELAKKYEFSYPFSPWYCKQTADHTFVEFTLLQYKEPKTDETDENS